MSNDNKNITQEEKKPTLVYSHKREIDRLMEEINILRLEGVLFCFDPRAAKRRTGRVTLTDARKQPITIDVDPRYGQPSVLAYKVLQAVFLKITEEGCTLTGDGRCEYPDTVSFSQRELAAMVGRSWSGRTSQQLFQAIMQLQSTKIVASLYEKATDAWQLASFIMLPSVLLAGKGETITRCSVSLAQPVMRSINLRHVAFFNLQRLNTLDTIGLVLYKRIFFHLSNLNHDTRRRIDLRFTKDYATVCREWLGGLEAFRHKSRITQQLGAHLESLKATGLIRRYVIEKNATGEGFNLSFYPGTGFFEDYQHYYLEQQRPQLRFKASADLRAIQQPLELVAFFHDSLGRSRSSFEEHETVYADELLDRHNPIELRDLIRYAVDEAKKTNFEMLYFGAVKRYIDAWAADRKRAADRNARQERIRACLLCNEHGFVEVRSRVTHQFSLFPCPHDGAKVEAFLSDINAELT